MIVPRGITILLLGLALGGLCLWAGTALQPDPTRNSFPSEREIAKDGDQYMNHRVSVSGTVVETAPRIIKTKNSMMFLIQGDTADPTVGDELWIFGTLQDNNRIVATNTVHREPWERQYMYGISFIAGMWVLSRFLNHWTLDTEEWTVVTRKTPMFTLSANEDA